MRQIDLLNLGHFHLFYKNRVLKIILTLAIAGDDSLMRAFWCQYCIRWVCYMFFLRYLVLQIFSNFVTLPQSLPIELVLYPLIHSESFCCIQTDILRWEFYDAKHLGDNIHAKSIIQESTPA